MNIWSIYTRNYSLYIMTNMIAMYVWSLFVSYQSCFIIVMTSGDCINCLRNNWCSTYTLWLKCYRSILSVLKISWREYYWNFKSVRDIQKLVFIMFLMFYQILCSILFISPFTLASSLLFLLARYPMWDRQIVRAILVSLWFILNGFSYFCLLERLCID